MIFNAPPPQAARY